MGYLESAQKIHEEMIMHRRYIHEHAETGEHLPLTKEYVIKCLKDYGYAPKEICDSGITATVGKGEKTILLRADMDALPMPEESGLAFASKNPEAAHTCGHDLHAAALLGAARLLKEREDKLKGTVKFMFQPGEEIFKGAHKMIEAGILECPRPDVAFAAHVTTRYKLGTVAFREGAAMASCYGFRILITGKGSHGANPEDGVDPVNIGAHIYLALQELIAREISYQNGAILTIGSFRAGNVPNTIPETAEMLGTLRTFDNQLRHNLIQRIGEIAEKTAEMFRGHADIEVLSDVPVEKNEPGLSASISRYITDLSGREPVEDILMTGSEDFAYISEKIPSVLVFVGALDPEHKGPVYGGHHSKVVFDENVLPVSAAIYAEVAERWLAEHA